MIIDTHLHLWNPADGYGWLAGAPEQLRRTFTTEQAAAELANAGIDAAVLVQADDTVADTEAMLAAADAWDAVAGIVGWVQLDDPATAERQLDEYGGRLCGIRHLTHDDPRENFLELPNVRRSLGLLADRGVPLDVPDAWPHQLHQLPGLADDLPGLRIVVDHLAKPPRGTNAMDAWAEQLRAVAERPNTVAKLSGLQLPGQPFTVDALRPVWELALECFGPGRLMYGGDWPMIVPTGGYVTHWNVIRTLIDELSPSERRQVLGTTAADVYGIEIGPGLTSDVRHA